MVGQLESIREQSLNHKAALFFRCKRPNMTPAESKRSPEQPGRRTPAPRACGLIDATSKGGTAGCARSEPHARTPAKTTVRCKVARTHLIAWRTYSKNRISGLPRFERCLRWASANSPSKVYITMGFENSSPEARARRLDRLARYAVACAGAGSVRCCLRE